MKAPEAEKMPPEVSAEVKALLKGWCRMQEEKYGEDWKNILAKDMADKTLNDLAEIQRLLITTYGNS